MMREATGNLAALDGESLETLGLSALALEAAGGGEIPFAAAPELTARLRVLAAAIASTLDNLNFMEAVSSGAPDARHRPGGLRWDR